jgi:hypothetical protein
MASHNANIRTVDCIWSGNKVIRHIYPTPNSKT